MPLTRLIIKNYKSIKNCDISLEKLNVLIGENGSGKTTILDAINYFYKNLTYSAASDNVFDENNRYSNELKIRFFAVCQNFKIKFRCDSRFFGR
jgi:AAA15 family ATPase/GTPase